MNKAMKQLVDLIPRLEADDCQIEQLDIGLRISFHDGQVFDVFEVGGWVQVGTAILSEADLDDMTYKEEVFEFLLLLNSRCLGCRFSLDPDGALLIVEDVPLDKVNENAINEAIDAISFADYVFFDLIQETGRIGVAPTEDEIDDVLTKKENAYDNFH